MDVVVFILVLCVVGGLVVGAGVFMAMRPTAPDRNQCEGCRVDASCADRTPRTVCEATSLCAMRVVGLAQAKASLPRLVQAIETGQEREIVIARNNHPVARLVAIRPRQARHVRIGLAKGKFEVPDTFDADNEEIARMFYGKQ